ncbi:hypothetical protein HB774_34615 (plasmid) [Rhizobium leguminosarum bv. viciae]|nr:hypothetical protein HB774_34615 [Rhizobium leguminosarum bv. viciae]
MPLFKVSEAFSRQLANKKEAFPNVQYVKKQTGEILPIINGQIVVDEFIPGIDGRVLSEPWYNHNSPSAVRDFKCWYTNLVELPFLTYHRPTPNELLNIAFRLGPLPTHPSATFPKLPPYGHLPLVGAANTTDEFLRCEATPVSYRLDVVNQEIKADTYAIPRSEELFIPTGLSVVGRYALPCYFPAVFKYLIQPTRRLNIDCGACVPQFGQAGGGVEVRVPRTTKAVKISKMPPLPVL